LDDFMAGHLWKFGEKDGGPLAIGRRYEYTVVLPILDTSGAKPKLFFNFYPAAGTAEPVDTTGIPQNDIRFYAAV
jgi:hypothetical protein